MANQERFDNARSTSEDILRDALENHKPEDDYNRIDLPKEEKNQQDPKRNVSDRFRNWTQQAKETVNRVNDRYPNAAKYAGYAAKAVRVGGKIHPVGRAVSYTPEAYEYGKQVWHYVQDAKAGIRAEEKAAKGRNYYEIAAKSRNRDLKNLESKLSVAEHSGKLEKVNWVDEVRHTNQSKIDNFNREIRSRKADFSVKEVLSKKGNNAELREKFAQSRAIADEYRKTVMRGSVEDKYHYLFDEARKGLGDEYYDLAKQPQRASQFDTFAARRLYEDGTSKEAVKQAIEKGVFYHALKDTEQRFKYAEETYKAIPKEADQVQKLILDWRKDKIEQIGDTKINPEEITELKKYREQARVYQATKTRELRELADETWVNYKAQNGQGGMQTAQEEYLLEVGRRNEAKQRHDDYTVVRKLMLAEHDDKAIKDTLKEYSPNANNSERLSSKFLNDARLQNQQDASFWRELQDVRDFKEAHSLSDAEKRLDRLQLSYDRQEATQTRGHQIRQTTKDIVENTRVSSHDDIEIER